IIYGTEKVIETVLHAISSIQERLDIFTDATSMFIITSNELLMNAYFKLKDRGVKIRNITEITPDTLSYSKKMMSVAEVRHIDGLIGSLGVSEREYIDTSPVDTSQRAIHGSMKVFVQQHQYIFDTIWKNVIPAEQRIQEIEKGIKPVGTRLLENPNEIFNHMKYVIENASKRLLCSSSGAMQLVYDNFFDLYKKILDKNKEEGGNGEGIRWITTIDQDNKDLVKLFLNVGVQIRHLRNLPPMNFAIDNEHFHATIERMEGGVMMRSLLTSNEPIYINHYNSIFEELWKNGIDAVQRIKDIEDSTYLADIEVFHDASRAREVYLDLVKEAKKEILFIFPTTDAFSRQLKVGTIRLVQRAAIERNVKVRILMPANKLIDNTVQNLDYPHKIDIRYIEQISGTKATILIVDRKESFVMEVKDDLKETFSYSVGFGTYCNSLATALSYVSIFESFWSQSEIINKLKKSEELQKDFINIAAHELRNPIQPILGLSSVILSQLDNEKHIAILGIINRNAKKLKQLADDMLDVTKIETKHLNLNKERFNLNDLIVNIIGDYKNQIDGNNVHLSCNFSDHNRKIKKESTIVYADKNRLSQVISNLLSNAIKSTKKGTIELIAEKKDNDEVIINIKDTGTGIAPKIIPRLFTKFSTGSKEGTGLGLYISKNIVEAHNGKIFAQNNSNGEKGSTFSFSLPLTTSQEDPHSCNLTFAQ
ncbi:MAG: ATP-binding protein, partial [Candidatus Nitrosopolaris sp.]